MENSTTINMMNVKELLDDIAKETIQRNHHRPAKLSVSESYKTLKNGSVELKIEMMYEIIKRFSAVFKSDHAWKVRPVYKNVLSALCREKIDIPESELEKMTKIVRSFSSVHFWEFPYNAFIKKINTLTKTSNFSDEFVRDLIHLRIPVPQWQPLKAEEKTYNAYIDKMMADHFGNGKNIIDEDDFGKVVHTFFNDLPNEEFENWKILCDKFTEINSSAKPKKTWLKSLDEPIKNIGKATVVKTFSSWIQAATELYKEGIRNQSSDVLTIANQNFLRNIVFATIVLNEKILTDDIDELGLVCLKKVRGYGQIAKKIGNACIMTFSLMPFEIGIEKLTKYRSKVKYPSTKKIIENRIGDVSRKEGMTPDEIEEMGVPSLGLNEAHEIREQMNDFVGLVAIESMKSVNLVYVKPDGKIQKTTPTAIKVNFADQIKILKKSAKTIKELLQANKYRIERFFLRQRSWKYNDWFKFYISHPLIGFLGKKLIWNFSKNDNNVNAIWHNGKWFNPHGENTDWIDEGTTIKLWHPIEASADYISTWRDWLMTQEIQQPFKQAFREIYIVTEAELNTVSYSNRFAAHIIRQFQFNALRELRGWKYTLQGAWDSHNTPFVELPNWNIKAEFWLEADHNGETHSSIFTHVFTDQVRFYENGQQLNMADVPALVFSEVMRDVDMFVGVTSIGNDPTWTDNGNDRFNTYWQRYTQKDLSATAKTRKVVLENLIPRLKITDQCSFTDKFLIVKGSIRTYKIHLGSGNILMEPNDQYLCIVPNRSGKKTDNLFLPFEGDQMLSIILSKAFLLADDKKIKDITITRQIEMK